jgi:hypothetical protein
MKRSGEEKGIRVVAVLALLALGPGAFAESVYKCRDARGAIAYQDHACSEGARQTQIEVANTTPSPPVASTTVASERGEARSDRSSSSHRERSTGSSRGGHSRDHEPVSYECRAANGEVFYRHSSCPKSIGTQDIARGPARGKRSPGGGRADVSAVPLSRSEACRRLAASGGRAGHDRDDQVSTYERNAGRDPCRHS